MADYGTQSISKNSAMINAYSNKLGASAGTPNTVSKETMSEGLFRSIWERFEKIGHQASRIEGIADRVVGSEPQDTCTPCPPRPAHHAGQLSGVFDSLSAVELRLRSVADRLETFV